ncbi:MAG TPA: DUF1640 domain-containing protein [Deltaproteobacteria bacterium]|nr:DUF1640 domain-containing protein [Deltaproteobacteria bacterium]
MTTITFDTLKFVKQLKAAGFREDQAKALSEAFKESQGTTVADLATKSDLKALELKFDGELKLLKWMLGFVLAGIAALILKAFFT